jgi:hypothetical protein
MSDSEPDGFENATHNTFPKNIQLFWEMYCGLHFQFLYFHCFELIFFLISAEIVLRSCFQNKFEAVPDAQRICLACIPEPDLFAHCSSSQMQRSIQTASEPAKKPLEGKGTATTCFIMSVAARILGSHAKVRPPTKLSFVEITRQRMKNSNRISVIHNSGAASARIYIYLRR